MQTDTAVCAPKMWMQHRNLEAIEGGANLVPINRAQLSVPDMTTASCAVREEPKRPCAIDRSRRTHLGPGRTGTPEVFMKTPLLIVGA